VIVKTISFHIKVLKEIERVDFSIRHQILELLGQLGSGVKLGMPASQPMPDVFHGVHELRIRDRSGQYRESNFSVPFF
jgi:phage-related protein